jgi:hypothetical protein
MVHRRAVLLHAGAVIPAAVTPNCHKLLFVNKKITWHGDCYPPEQDLLRLACYAVRRALATTPVALFCFDIYLTNSEGETR